MDIAQALARIELLCSRDFPAKQGRAGSDAGGPGYLMAELRTSRDFWEDDGTEREQTEVQYDSYRDGLTERLAARWGRPHQVSLASVFERSETGEEIPEPWASLSAHVPDLHLWRIPDRDRWLALGVSQWDKELPYQLLALVTEVDPP